MSPLWLLLIIPLTFAGGYCLGAVMASGAAADQCHNCIYEQKKPD